MEEEKGDQSLGCKVLLPAPGLQVLKSADDAGVIGIGDDVDMRESLGDHRSDSELHGDHLGPADLAAVFFPSG